MATKDDVLALLAQRENGVISGQEIARSLNISRAAVWKAIEALRRDGFKIQAATNRGYSLCMQDAPLSEAGIRAYLPAEFRGCAMKVLASVDSTNTQARRMALEGAPHGAVVAAREQTAGRGRLGKSFFSPRDTGIYMSVILRPDQAGMSDVQMSTVMAAVAAGNAIEETTGLATQIKWVNDLYLNGKKVSGILTEAVSDVESGGVECVVIGTGINLTTALFPPEVAHIAGSLQRAVTPCRLAAALYVQTMTLWKKMNDPALIATYRSRSFLLGRRISYVRSGETFEATALDVNERGNLVVRLDDGTQLALSSGEVSVKFN